MNQTKNLLLVALVAMGCLLFSCKKKNDHVNSDTISNKTILQWNEVTFRAMGGSEFQHSLLAACTYAMVHAAMHDAVNAVEPLYTSYAYTKTQKDADPEVAAASAARHVIKTSFPASAAYVDSVYTAFMNALPDNEAKQKGIETGIEAANTILSLGHNASGALDPIGQPVPATKPGDYKLVPPFNFIFAPFWENAKLFSLQTKDQFRCLPPPSINSELYTADFNEVKSIGSKNSETRNADQTFFAKYWYEYSEVGWNRIARNVAASKNLGLHATARLFALMNFAVADAYTAGWDSKIHYNFWRPYTAIREAAADGNNATSADPNWEPAEPTPPIQDYPSTHSALGNAAATVLASVFGNQTAFSANSPTAIPANASRSFQSFSQASNENAESRVMAGIHFRFSCKAGQDLGNKIGKWTIENHLKPLN